MSASQLPRTLFVGKAKTAVAWYRCALPAMYLDLDWVGMAGAPPELLFATGMTERPLSRADMAGYDIVVLQQPDSEAWLREIRALQAAGTVVLFEIDDYVHSLRKKADHAFAKQFGPKRLHGYEMCMRASDGIIASTPWLASRYRAFNPRVWVCRNGLDLGRYNLTRPARPGVAIGWSGGMGHTLAATPWLKDVATVMEQRPETRFVSVGQRFADSLLPRFGPERCMSVPFAPLDTYPATMTMFDLALAPAGKSNFYRGKSDLRWLEASALGVPLIADPDVYPDIEHGVTGFHAGSPAEMRELLLELVDDHELRERVGAQAREHVRRHRDMRVMSAQWEKVLREITGSSAQAEPVPTAA